MIKIILLTFLITLNAFSNNIAVVIVDMQYGFYTRGQANQSQGLINLVNKQKELLYWAKKEKLPVVFFEYYGHQETDFALKTALWGYEFSIITKYDDNGFSGKSLALANELFDSLNVDTLIIGGINASGCVKRTSLGALKQGYKVISSADIVADMYQYPPVHPQGNWFIDHENFQGESDLASLKRFLVPNRDSLHPEKHPGTQTK